MTKRFFFLFSTAVLLATGAPPRAAVAQQPPADAPVLAEPGYADLADLVIASPLVVDATIRSASRIKGAEAAGLAPGRTRFYVEADVTTLVRGASAIPARVGWVVDVAPDWRGRVPSLKKRRVLAFARPVAGQAGQIQLVEPGAQHDWSPALEQRVRAVASELAAPDAPPVITDVGNAFHVPGALPGEGETQIFLRTRDDRPAALSILRRPGEQPRWSVALSEIIDDSAPTPRRDTLLWYRLACALPATLPERSTASLSPDDATQAQADYAFVIEQLGACRPVPAAATAGPVSAGAGPV
ncbi:hypothetical protein [Sphingomonas sp. 8AM]|uniref:hypothetical protein n=1 Tax=Sphingomonas sp. 8AM TaxID=2653170 RepID=UPI0012F15966|nr:hypothetical protein [Sphingomonas sp. 8AM]VXC98739.1 conserved exported hypothetical protein [Sphingomonas sp. 8AM]